MQNQAASQASTPAACPEDCQTLAAHCRRRTAPSAHPQPWPLPAPQQGQSLPAVAASRPARRSCLQTHLHCHLEAPEATHPRKPARLCAAAAIWHLHAGVDHDIESMRKTGQLQRSSSNTGIARSRASATCATRRHLTTCSGRSNMLDTAPTGDDGISDGVRVSACDLRFAGGRLRLVTPLPGSAAPLALRLFLPVGAYLCPKHGPA